MKLPNQDYLHNFRWTDPGYVSGKKKIIRKNICEQLFSTYFLPRIISGKIKINDKLQNVTGN